jgi:hypothetical protein
MEDMEGFEDMFYIVTGSPTCFSKKHSWLYDDCEDVYVYVYDDSSSHAS